MLAQTPKLHKGVTICHIDIWFLSRRARAAVPSGTGNVIHKIDEDEVALNLDSCIIGVELEWCYTL